MGFAVYCHKPGKMGTSVGAGVSVFPGDGVVVEKEDGRELFLAEVTA